MHLGFLLEESCGLRGAEVLSLPELAYLVVVLEPHLTVVPDELLDLTMWNMVRSAWRFLLQSFLKILGHNR